MLNIRELEAFRAFIECGSVTLAADRLGRTQPQVGRLLASLEESVGFSLFDRVGKRLQATPEGWRFYEEVDRVIRELESLTRSADQIRSGSSEHLRILVAPHVTRALVSPALVAVQRTLPGFTAEVASRVRLDIETWITHEQFDIGLSVLPIDNPSIDVEPFVRTSAVIAMSDTHELADRNIISFADIRDLPLVATHSRSLLRQHLERLFRAQKRTANIRYEATNGLIACELAALGLGIALADPFVAISAGASNLVVRPFVEEMPMEYGFLYPIGKSRSKATAVFSDAVKTIVREQVAQLALPENGFVFLE
ncbi:MULTISPECIES: LysR family transcriptional regulator [Burkholderia cepacia complex]|uniref:LysR family transcriptional regulator n=1 Tax=Burkholderia cepacia complex TaxID=87882 RepID=UPI0007584B5A|nr:MULTISPECIES: LysR family transcriptional regulator [Burkholderia cepacia complex]KVS34286.1 LysR family transcriptional regulator [Burkholderia cepacia]MBR8203380.1 LysR family transcriptional regulator [Burkholderia vietnamiensis]MBR8282569.1 LysR family transcriptional regulator [Burkholderia vietnamiensis]MCA8119077.1 LysR family transcriptional regulator [Burkholderia cepacia]